MPLHGKSKISITFVTFLILISLYFVYNGINNRDESTKPRIRSSSSPKAGIKAKMARQEYFHRLLRDPKIDQIPPRIRQSELEYAQKLRDLNSLSKKLSGNNIFWQFAGPVDVGGRTRALAVDVTNANTLIAGGVSGGIWKSTDGGNSWSIKNTVVQPLSVTSVAQDTRDGQTNTWYYSTGEYFNGNSASDRGRVAHFFGTGIYKSTDNGESWGQLAATADSYPNIWTVPSFDIVTKVCVSPTTGTVFTANNGVGIYRSTDGGNTFNIVLGNGSTPRYADVVATADGTIIGTYSQNSAGSSPVTNPGIYKSASDGSAGSWVEITPDYLKNNNNDRTVLAVAPSNNDILYSLTVLPSGEMKFFKISISTGASEDRSDNLTEYPERGDLEAQGGYNMVLGVKPDDENFVLIGLTNLFRSRDGFATKPGPEDEADVFIGGYNNNNFFYPNNHPDHHVLVFDPTNPNRMWNGNDGGIYLVEDIRENLTGNELLPWIDKNQGYNVTQFYTASISNIADDDRIMGGTQDNGSPYFTFNGINTSSSEDVSSGDGAYGYFGNTYAYTSSFEGQVLRRNYVAGGAPTGIWATVYPSNAGGQLFINPFRVDPNNENYMYYPSGSEFWRNNALSSIRSGVNGGTTVGWTEVAGLEETGDYVISAIQISQQPAHILYYGSSSDAGQPKVSKVTNSLTASTGDVYTLSEAEGGAYIHDIAINPDDADQILVVISNYNTESLFYSSNGGQTFSTIQGNLSGDRRTQGTYTYWTGPSIRSATIVPTEDGLVYLVGTSTGVYSTRTLDGDNTQWVQESDDLIGNTVTEYIDSRKADATIVAGTHGRGIYIGKYDTSLSNGGPPVNPQSFYLAQNYPNPFNPGTTIKFYLPESENVVLTVYNMNGREVAEVMNQQVIKGLHFVYFDAGDLASGIYFYTLRAGKYQATQKMMVLK
jgi:hypothetical protein